MPFYSKSAFKYLTTFAGQKMLIYTPIELSKIQISFSRHFKKILSTYPTKVTARKRYRQNKRLNKSPA
jgi:hypothetical protein